MEVILIIHLSKEMKAVAARNTYLKAVSTVIRKLHLGVSLDLGSNVGFLVQEASMVVSDVFSLVFQLEISQVDIAQVHILIL